MLKIIALLLAVSLVYCAPVQKSKNIFKEAEYDVTLRKEPGEKRYFIKADEIPIYQHQFEKIRELGEEISCKIRGNCQGEKRGKISISEAHKKSMYDNDIEGIDDKSIQEQLGNLGRGDGGAEMNADALSPAAMMDEKKDSFYGDQKDASNYGQQPQMDIKMSPQESAAIHAGMGAMDGPKNPGPGGPPQGFGQMNGNDGLMKMQEQQNDDLIQNSVMSKMNFMDGANKGRMSPEFGGMNPSGLTQGMLGGSVPGMPGDGGPMNGLGGRPAQGFHGLGEGKDDMGTNGMSNSVSDNDIMKAEDIQPSEMQGIDHFLKDSNHMDKSVEPTNDDFPGDNEAGELGKTNVDIGGVQSSIENTVNNEHSNSNSEGAGPDQQNPFGGMQNANAEPIRPGGPEVPTLNNLGLGMSAAEMGPMGGPPNLNFVQDNTRQMIEQNSDYKVPQTAFSNLWNTYMSSTQSQLGERDPSANSRGAISRPVPKAAKSTEGKLHRRSNVEKVKKRSLDISSNKQNSKNNKNFVYVPAFVIRNVLKQVKKSMLTTKDNVNGKKTNATKKFNSKDPPLYITEKQGKRYLVINPENPLIQGFANVDDQYTSFAIPAYVANPMMNMNRVPAFPNQFMIPYGVPTARSFPPLLGNTIPPHLGFEGPLPLSNGYPISSSPLPSNGLFRGFVTVPVFSRIPPSNYRNTFNNGPSYEGRGFRNSFNNGPSYEGGIRNSFNHGPSYEGDFRNSFNNDLGYDEEYNYGPGPGASEYPKRRLPDFPEASEYLGGPPLDSFHPDEGLYQRHPDDPEQISVDYRPRVYAPHDEIATYSDRNVERYSNNNNINNNYEPSPSSDEFDNRDDGIQNFVPRPFSAEDYQNMNNAVVHEGWGSRHELNRPFNLFAEIRKRSEYGKPYVFTKEHVGFGPITVEAKTASSASKGDKEEDPKDDE